MKLVLQRVEVNEREITLEVYALTEDKLPGNEGAEGEMARMRPHWLSGRGAIKILFSHSATLAASVFARTNRIPGKN